MNKKEEILKIINSKKVGDVLPEDIVYQYIQAIHADYEGAFIDGDLGYRIEHYPEYKLEWVDFDDIDYDEFWWDENVVDEYEKEYLINKKYPPIVISHDGRIIDGTHRANALINAGEDKILAFVGMGNDMIYMVEQRKINNFKKFKLLLESLMNTDDFEYLDDLGGSTGAYLYKDSKGKKWIFKPGSHPKHAANEFLANRLYKKFGVKVPQSFAAKVEGDFGTVTEYLENSVALGEANGLKNKVAKNFLVDVLLANWDTLGTNWNMDNIRVKNGEVYRVDVGGSLLYRAQGETKGDRFSNIPNELKTLRDPNISYFGSDVFGKLTDDELKNQFTRLAKEYLTNDKSSLKKFMVDLKEIIFDDDIKLEEKEKNTIYKKLLKRSIYLYKIFNGD